MTKDLIEGLEKDIEKLKRLEENLQRRKVQSQNGGIFVEETEEDREKIRIDNLRIALEAESGYILSADEKRI